MHQGLALKQSERCWCLSSHNPFPEVLNTATGKSLHSANEPTGLGNVTLYNVRFVHKEAAVSFSRELIDRVTTDPAHVQMIQHFQSSIQVELFVEQQQQIVNTTCSHRNPLTERLRRLTVRSDFTRENGLCRRETLTQTWRALGPASATGPFLLL